ncbi:MAG: GDYXXLXY domain-containing protein [Kiritimatiellia bacterium]
MIMRTRTKIIIFAACLQLAVVVFMAAQREWVVQFGDRVFLQTLPVDPRDIFRGDYVRLDYEISHLPRRLWPGDLEPKGTEEAAGKLDKDERVYTVLETNRFNVARAVRVTVSEPGVPLFIRGRVKHHWDQLLNVRYSIEALFVEQGKGLEIEEKRRRDDGIRIPMEVEVALGGNGLGVITGYRWSSIGIGLDITEDEDRNPVTATVTLLNASDKPLAVVALPEAGSLELVPDMRTLRGEATWQWVGRSEQTEVKDQHIVVLQPEETHRITVDFTDPAWFVQREGGKPVSLSTPGRRRWQRFRFVYNGPPPSETQNLQKSDIIWHGEVVTAAFRGARID